MGRPWSHPEPVNKDGKKFFVLQVPSAIERRDISHCNTPLLRLQTLAFDLGCTIHVVPLQNPCSLYLSTIVLRIIFTVLHSGQEQYQQSVGTTRYLHMSQCEKLQVLTRLLLQPSCFRYHPSLFDGALHHSVSPKAGWDRPFRSITCTLLSQ